MIGAGWLLALLSAHLAAPPAVLDVVTAPRAWVEVDGRVEGRSPLRLKVPGGLRRIEIFAPGWRSVTIHRLGTAKERRSLLVRLGRRPRTTMGWAAAGTGLALVLGGGALLGLRGHTAAGATAGGALAGVGVVAGLFSLWAFLSGTSPRAREIPGLVLRTGGGFGLGARGRF